MTHKQYETIRTAPSKWKDPKRKMTDILDEVVENTGITRPLILGNRRTLKISRARAAACYAMHEEGHSYSAIGRFLNICPSSVRYSVKRIEGMLQ